MLLRQKSQRQKNRCVPVQVTDQNDATYVRKIDRVVVVEDQGCAWSRSECVVLSDAQVNEHVKDQKQKEIARIDKKITALAEKRVKLLNNA